MLLFVLYQSTSSAEPPSSAASGHEAEVGGTRAAAAQSQTLP